MKHLLYTLATLFCIQTAAIAQHSYTSPVMHYTVTMPDAWKFTKHDDTAGWEIISYSLDSANKFYIQTYPYANYKEKVSSNTYSRIKSIFAADRVSEYLQYISNSDLNAIKATNAIEKVGDIRFYKIYMRTTGAKSYRHVYLYQWDDGLRNLEVILMFDDYKNHKVMKKAFTKLCNTL